MNVLGAGLRDGVVVGDVDEARAGVRCVEFANKLFRAVNGVVKLLNRLLVGVEGLSV